jgi:pimeloyl-ACP methyl ester carboxylesterase
MPDSGATMDSRESVVLVNGLWLTDPALWLLARRLRRAGFQTFSFSYPSVRQDLRANAAHLHEFLARIPGATVHLVGYSLGGLVIRALFHFHPGQRPGRVVLLGSPQTGSRAAEQLRRFRLGRRLTGRSVAELTAGLPQTWPWPAHETGIIAGNRPFGLGRLAATLPNPNDGTVQVEETVVAGACDTRVLPVAHSAMLLSAAVAQQVVHFLRHGAFRDQPATAPSS